MILMGLMVPVSGWAQATDTDPGSGSASIQVEMQVIISQSSIPLNDSVRLDFRVIARGRHTGIAIMEPPIPEVSNLDIVGSGSSNQTTQEESIKQYTYFLKPKTIGMAYIEPIRVEYRSIADSSTYELWSKRLSISVTDALIHEETSFSFAFLLACLLGAIGFVILIIYRKKIAAHHPAAPIEDIPLDSAQAAEIELQQIVQEKIDNHTKIDRIHHVVLHFLREYTQSGIGLTGREVVKKLLNQGLTDSRVFDIQDFFDRCDLIKFSAGSITRNELDELVIKAREILKIKNNLNTMEEKR